MRTHLESVCMGYAEHFRLSAWFGLQLLAGALRAFAHALVPSLYASSTSSLLRRLDTVARESGCR